MAASNEYNKVKAGSLLISEPWCDAPYFKRSVVLIVEHVDSGDVGFILNKCIKLNIYDLMEDFPETDLTLCLGGPVSPSTLHFIHNLGDTLIPGAVHVSGNIYWGGSFLAVKQLVMSGLINKDNIKFFIGYSGWSKGQLAEEFAAGGWGACDSDGHDVISETDDLWYSVVQSDSEYCEWGLIPEDPADN